jgi:excinuclease ABC subunit C
VNQEGQAPKAQASGEPVEAEEQEPGTLQQNERAEKPGVQVSLSDKLDQLPARPGVYLFRDAEGVILYIGKAKSLRSRVRSYFQAGGSDVRMYLPRLVSQIRDLSTIVTQSEKEATILENSLIKEHQPRFNVKLRDDKEYLSIRIDTSHAWPRLDLVRRPKADGAHYFGPYHSATSARRTLHLVEKHFKLRTCTDREFASRKRPCLKYQIKRCPGPCVFEIDRQTYRDQVAAVELFLDGRHAALAATLRERMRDYAAAMHYESAAICRDQIAAVDSVKQAQRVVSVESTDQDVLGLYREGDLVELSVLQVREGRVVQAIAVSHPRLDLADEEVVAAFLRETYDAERGPVLIPDEILVPVLPEGVEGVAEWLSDRRAEFARSRAERAPKAVKIISPERGPKKQLLDLAIDNAQHAFAEKRRAREDIEQRLHQLQTRLRLPTVPRRIECTDISHLGGNDTVGSVVALKDGLPDKSRYKSYRVQSVEGGDDYGAMYEVLSRRFRRGRDARPGETWDLPDLFLVDGGRGQLAVALAAAKDLGLEGLQLAGLAKERETAAGDKLVDRVYLPDQKNAIALKPNSPELFLLARVRDEAHRFANKGRSRLGKGRRMLSLLDRVPGIGPKAKQLLLTHFGGIDNLKSASAEELLGLPGIDRRHVRALERFWKSEEAIAEELVANTSDVPEQSEDLTEPGDEDAGALGEELEAEPATELAPLDSEPQPG